ncbi:hypothetical protein HMI01_06240 [Halolactibacillus miurensis]|uniref:DUF3006 domain-containing protein n=1 Tax=Halolactibacillus miurensis TaxID=306541 RepID=A0A1I6R2G7_9BACI|nr:MULTISPECIES: DUF3006 domain-containing protein [Halolactibacillus]GEM03636.1 hypothetical protein HMI01_06240 [Halolactibacillus miurensis]SFS58876.1 Protein of unknown function [Halolactibacillus miurensis]
MKTLAVIDRFSDLNTAVILVESMHKQFVVKKDQLPTGAKPQDYLDVEVADESLQILGINTVETTKRKKNIHEKMEKLRAKNSAVSRRRR